MTSRLEASAAAGSRAEASTARRAAILHAALACFVNKGYAATSIEDVRLVSGASTGSIYHHFESKEGLAAALYLEGLRDYQAGVTGMLLGSDGAESGIKGVVRYHLAWVAQHADLARFLFVHPENEFSEARARHASGMNGRFFLQVGGWLRHHMAAGSVRQLPIDLYVPIVLGPSYEFSRRWLAGQTAVGPEAAQDLLAEAAWLSLRT